MKLSARTVQSVTPYCLSGGPVRDGQRRAGHVSGSLQLNVEGRAVWAAVDTGRAICIPYFCIQNIVPSSSHHLTPGLELAGPVVSQALEGSVSLSLRWALLPSVNAPTSFPSPLSSAHSTKRRAPRISKFGRGAQPAVVGCDHGRFTQWLALACDQIRGG
jgi:hypothetical protein